MRKSAVAWAMHTARTAASAQATARSSSFSNCSEFLAGVEDEGHRLFHVEALGLGEHQRLDRVHEGLLVRLDDLRELGLQLGEVLVLRDLPGAAHVGLG